LTNGVPCDRLVLERVKPCALSLKTVTSRSCGPRTAGRSAPACLMAAGSWAWSSSKTKTGGVIAPGRRPAAPCNGRAGNSVQPNPCACARGAVCPCANGALANLRGHCAPTERASEKGDCAGYSAHRDQPVRIRRGRMRGRKVRIRRGKMRRVCRMRRRFLRFRL
jgi:hypothetical protein